MNDKVFILNIRRKIHCELPKSPSLWFVPPFFARCSTEGFVQYLFPINLHLLFSTIFLRNSLHGYSYTNK